MVTRHAAAVLAALALTACTSDRGSPPSSTTETAAPTSAAAPRSGTLSPTSSTSSTETSTSSSSATSTTGRPATDLGKRGTPRGGLVSPADVEGTNAAAVADAYVRTTLTIDTRLDNSHTDAQRRAKRWLAPELAQRLSQRLPGASGWHRMTKDDTWTAATVTDVTPAGGDPTKGLRSERLMEATVSTHTKGSKKPTTRRTTMGVTLERDAENKPWRVTGMQTY